MLTYKIYQTLDLIIGILLFPIQIVLNLVLNILSNLGIFFMPILLCLNLIYLFYYPLYQKDLIFLKENQLFPNLHH